MMIAARNAFLMSGAKPWTNPYVTDSLVAMWDGINNTGTGRHAASLDSIGAVLGQVANVDSGMVVSDTGLSGDALSTRLTLSISFPALSDLSATYEIGITIDSIATVSGNRRILSNYSSGSIATGVNIVSPNRQVTPYFSGAQYPQSPAQYAAIGALSAITARRNGVGAYTINLFVNGTRSRSTGYSGGSGVTIGALTAAIDHMRGTLHWLRVYSRALSDAEVAANHAIDKTRFSLP